MVKKVFSFSFSLLFPYIYNAYMLSYTNIKIIITLNFCWSHPSYFHYLIYSITIKCNYYIYSFVDISDFVFVFCKEDKCDRGCKGARDRGLWWWVEGFDNLNKHANTNFLIYKLVVQIIFKNIILLIYSLI